MRCGWPGWTASGHSTSRHGEVKTAGGLLAKQKARLKENYGLTQRLDFGSVDSMKWSRQVVRTRMWTLVGARMHAFGSRGLGVSTFPWGRVTDTRERRSRHLSFYDP
ncbi:hypothetical protein CRG98_010629 [Punica granatum]|uniref:Uncharacterized protein n=1 Tax=Punica granatum TaxID=22663 RepID=A0A2I0KKH9_PUNGR|nr:hypothetical protein CRG98_010629 [Punica granatum]